MESENWELEELDFTAKCQVSVTNQRRILEHYSKSGEDRYKKSKSEVFTRENIQAFLTLLKVDPNKLEFIDPGELYTELTVFLQGLKCHLYKIGETIQIGEGRFIILFDGCLAKKVQNHLSMNYTIMMSTLFPKKNRNSNNQNQRQKVKQSKMTSPFITSLKKINEKKIQADHTTVPKILYFDVMDSKPYECRTKVILFEQNQLSLQKFQKWIESKEKQGIISFFAYFFGLEDRKIAAKYVSKARKNYHKNKSEILIEPDTIYLVYKGELRLSINGNSTVLSKNSSIFRQNTEQNFEAKSTSDETLIFIIRVQDVEEFSNEDNEQLKQRLRANNTLRLQLFQRVKIQEESQLMMEPVFDMNRFRLNQFQREEQDEKDEKQLIKKKYLVPRPYSSNHNSKRFRVTQPSTSVITLASDLSCLLSNYPYIKTVESQQRAFNRLRSAATPPRAKSIKSRANKCISSEEKRKIDKEIKKLYYNDKVRRLKIKNIASKQIPNGHKKDFNSEKAEQEISSLLLFKNIIEYPINGVSENASKESRNKKVIAKLTKMSSINSRIERKTTDNHYLKKDSIKHVHQVNLQKSSDEKISRNFVEIKNETDASQMNIYSHYCTNVLSPHLPTQKEVKYRKCSQRQIGKQNKLEWTLCGAFENMEAVCSPRMKTTI